MNWKHKTFAVASGCQCCTKFRKLGRDCYETRNWDETRLISKANILMHYLSGKINRQPHGGFIVQRPDGSQVEFTSDIIDLIRYALGIAKFGFKANRSTDQCSWLVKETINYYSNQNSLVYGCFLDCSKAFDCVDYEILFSKLLGRKLPAVIVRFIACSYINQTSQVKW